jgi:hypothetical protein
MAAAAILAAKEAAEGAPGGGALSEGPAPPLLDSLEEESRSLLLSGAPAPLGADALAAAVGILRSRLDDEASACGLSSRLKDLLTLLDARPDGGAAAAAAAAREGGEAAGGEAPFWGAPDEWGDIREALMAVGVDATLDEEAGATSGGGGGGGGVDGAGPGGVAAASRLEPEAAMKLVGFLAELQQQRAGGGGGADGGGGGGASARGGPPEAGAADSRRQRAAGGSGGGSGSGAAAAAAAGASVGVTDEDVKWWEAVTAAYGRLAVEAKASATAGGSGGSAAADAEEG